MSLGTNNNIKAAMPLLGTGSLAGQISIGAGATINVAAIPETLFAAIRTAAVAIPQTPPNYKYPYAMDLLGAATGLILVHAITGYNAGYPVPHDVGANANPAPLRIAMGDRTGTNTSSQLSIKNTTGGALLLNVICYAE